jgi:hypothetical protein
VSHPRRGGWVADLICSRVIASLGVRWPKLDWALHPQATASLRCHPHQASNLISLHRTLSQRSFLGLRCLRMDPLSITATCFGLIGTIGKTSLAITGFVHDVRSARSDLDSVSRELQSLKTLLELLVDDASNPTNGTFPETLKRQIAGITTNCGGVVSEKTLEKHEGNKLSKNTMWVMGGKDDVAKLRSSLEAHKSALEIAFDMVTMYVCSALLIGIADIILSGQ